MATASAARDLRNAGPHLLIAAEVPSAVGAHFRHSSRVDTRKDRVQYPTFAALSYRRLRMISSVTLVPRPVDPVDSVQVVSIS